MDEVESVLNHFHSETFKGASRLTFEFLSEIIKNSKNLIALDGDYSNRALSLYIYTTIWARYCNRKY